jgi:hypothetical protein
MLLRLLALPLALCALVAPARSDTPPPPPRFHLPGSSPAEQVALREGAEWLARFTENAAAEAPPGIAGRLMGRRGCWTAAVETLRADCRGMDDDASRRLALTLANCQLESAGLKTYACLPTTPLKACTKSMTEKVRACRACAPCRAAALPRTLLHFSRARIAHAGPFF